MIESKCKCGKGHIETDPTSRTLTAGVIGLVGYKDVHIVNGEVACSNCKSLIYKEIGK